MQVRTSKWQPGPIVIASALAVIATAQICANQVYAKEPPNAANKSAANGAPASPTVRSLQATGSRVVMDLPPSFQIAPRFVGFYDLKREISFVIADMPPEAFDKMREAFTPALLKEKGFLDPREGTLGRNDTYLYRRFAQSSPNGLVQKFVLIFATSEATAVVSANVPTPLLSSGAATEAEIESYLASAKLTQAKSDQPQVATLGDPASLKLALTYGQTQIWTVDGKQGEQGSLSPSIIIAASVSFDATTKPATFAATALSSLSGHRNIALIGRAKPAKLGTHEGIELTATAEDDKTGQPRGLYQFLIPQAGGYVRFIGIAPGADKDLWFASFRRSAASLRLKD